MGQVNIKILKLDNFICIDELKNIKNLPLVELKIRLYENKKKSLMDSLTSGLSSFNLASSFSSFNNKVDSIQYFIEG
jgi:hypothetical protein